MFKFLKEKLGNVLKKISKKAEEEAKEEVVEIEKEATTKKKPDKKKELKKTKEKKKVVETKEVFKEPAKEEKPVAEEPRVEGKAEVTETLKEGKKGFFSRLFKKKEKIEEPGLEAEEKLEEERAEEKLEIEVPEAAPEISKEEEKAEETEEPKEKKGFFAKLKEKVVTKRISKDKFEELFADLEIVLLENNVAFEVVEKIKHDLSEKIVDKPIRRGKISDEIRKTLKESIEGLFDVEPIDVLKMIKEKKEKPFVVLFLGINGSGKTTTIAKFANILKENKISCLLVAGDTWRAAAISQLEEHGKKLGVRVIKHDYGSDPAAVAFDGIRAAQANKIDVVLIDTAGRQHSNVNLMNELDKIVRVAKPDLKIFIGESITGNDCVEQVKDFNAKVQIDGIILTKVDVDEKGGAAISVSYISKKPILYIGLGQEYNDLKKFDARMVIAGLGL